MPARRIKPPVSRASDTPAQLLKTLTFTGITARPGVPAKAVGVGAQRWWGWRERRHSKQSVDVLKEIGLGEAEIEGMVRSGATVDGRL